MESRKNHNPTIYHVSHRCNTTLICKKPTQTGTLPEHTSKHTKSSDSEDLPPGTKVSEHGHGPLNRHNTWTLEQTRHQISPEYLVFNPYNIIIIIIIIINSMKSMVASHNMQWQGKQ